MATTEPDAGQASPKETSAHDFIDLKSLDAVKELKKEEIYAYIEKLHAIIRKYDTNIASYKQKLKHFLTKEIQHSEKCTQVSNGDLLEIKCGKEHEGTQEEEEAVKEISETDAFSFVDEMRQAAKHAENLNNFVYEPTSGMYYDPKSGYYYNAEYGLYYDGNTGCYYSYDQAKDSFEFHSQAQVQANGGEQQQQQAENDDQDDDDVEFDEHGGVITDKATLKQIKADKQKQKERAERSKRKAKKKQRKQKKKEKRHKSKKRHKDRRNRSDDDDAEYDDNSDNENCRKRARKLNDVEDGELSHSSSSSSSGSSDEDGDKDASNSDSGVPIFKVSSRFQDIAKQYPPCLRIIVQETNVPELTVGSLHLLTYLGGSLGREGDSDVIIPDVNVSKCHLDFEYDQRKGVYKCRDMGSRNGTILNGVRMSETLATSKWQDVVHGSIISIAQTRLLCHVHEGNSTCGLCEPGLLIETSTTTGAATSANANVLSHREQLKRIQKKYGLENEKFVEASGSQSNPNYNDRSAQRRSKVGSSTDKEKTEVACVNTEIASTNKGFKMLSKLGWQKGDTLGKTNQGLLAPINVVSNEGKTGLGSTDPAPSASRPVDKRKYANLKITQARYERAKDIFKEADESD